MHNFRACKALGRIIIIFGNKHIDTQKKKCNFAVMPQITWQQRILHLTHIKQ